MCLGVNTEQPERINNNIINSIFKNISYAYRELVLSFCALQMDFANVDLPVSNLAQSSDINFNLKIDFVSSEE